MSGLIFFASKNNLVISLCNNYEKKYLIVFYQFENNKWAKKNLDGESKSLLCYSKQCQ